MSPNSNPMAADVHRVNHEAFEDSMLIYVDMFEVLGKQVCVETTHGEVMDMLKMSKTTAEHVYTKIYREIIDFNDDAVAKEISEGVPGAMQKWSDFCSDCVIMLCARQVATGKGILVHRDKPDGKYISERDAL